MSRNIKLAGLFDKLEDGNVLRINTLFSYSFNVSAFSNYDKAIE